MLILLVLGHGGDVILDFLLVVYTTLNTEVVLLIGVVLLEVLSHGSRNNLLGGSTDGVHEKVTVETTGIQMAEIIYEVFGTHAIGFVERIL